jgi:hypothetical protein
MFRNLLRYRDVTFEELIARKRFRVLVAVMYAAIFALPFAG